MAAAINMPASTEAKYSRYYDDNDHFNGSYDVLLNPYSIATAGNPNYSPAQVRSLAANARSEGIATAFLQVGTDGSMNIFLQLDKVESRMGRPDHRLTGNMLVQYGELMGNNQAAVLHLPDSAFNVAPAVRVPTAAAIETAVAGDPDITVMGPFADGDAASEVVRCRHITVVPPPFVSALLARRDYSAVEVWQIVHPLCVAKGWEESCAPFLNFIRCAMTCSVQGDPPLVARELPPPILLDAEMVERRDRIIRNDFPFLNPALSGLQQNQVAQHLGDIRRDFQERSAAEDARRLEEKSRTVADKFGSEALVDIMILCQAQSADAVAEIWTKWSMAPKSQHCTLLQKALDKRKGEVKEHGLQLIASVSILNTLKNLVLVMVCNNSILTGLNPFRLHEESNETQARNAQVAYAMTHNAGAAPTLSDATDMVQPTAQAPVALHQARQMIARLAIYVAVIMGKDHPLVDALDAWKFRFTAMENQLHNLMATEPLLPSLLVKRVAISTSNWFRGQLQPGQVTLYPVPVFTDVFDAIEDESQWKPNTPATFLAALGLSHLATPPPAPAPVVPAAPRAPRAPAARVPSAPTAPAPESAVFLNTNFNPIFASYRDSSVGCRALRDRIGAGTNPLRALPLSKVDNKPMCLAFHAKGVCNPTCGRLADHVPYTTAEYAPLKEWCGECFPEE